VGAVEAAMAAEVWTSGSLEAGSPEIVSSTHRDGTAMDGAPDLWWR
jgi:hypothetical protein